MATEGLPQGAARAASFHPTARRAKEASRTVARRTWRRAEGQELAGGQPEEKPWVPRTPSHTALSLVPPHWDFLLALDRAP